MLIRIRLPGANAGLVGRSASAALALASLLAPSAVLAFSIMLWSLMSQLRRTGDFFISRGVFSHWQVWLGCSAALFLSFRLLDRYARHSLEERSPFRP